MPLSFVGVVAPDMPAFSSLTSLVIVEAEVEREKVFAKGPRCVSLSSKMCMLAISTQRKEAQDLGCATCWYTPLRS